MDINNESQRLSLNSIDRIILDKNLKKKNLNTLIIEKIEKNKIHVIKNDYKNLIDNEVNEVSNNFTENLQEEFIDIFSDEEEEDEENIESNKDSINSFKIINLQKNKIKITKENTLDTLNSKKNLEINLENDNFLDKKNITELKFNNLECVICLNKFKTKDKLIEINKCSHYFHSNCITQWIINKGSKNLCPLCK